jgi:hypothetical protein
MCEENFGVISIFCPTCGRELKRSEKVLNGKTRIYYCVNYGICPDWSHSMQLPEKILANAPMNGL